LLKSLKIALGKEGKQEEVEEKPKNNTNHGPGGRSNSLRGKKMNG